MKNMKVLGKKVIFKCTHSEVSYGMAYERWEEVKQRWEIPELELYGFIDPRETIAEIHRAITKEVKYDLEERHKREMGIRK